MMKMSSSMKVIPMFSYIQNINQIEGEPINYTLNNYPIKNPIHIEQNPNITRYNSSALFPANGNTFKANPSAIITNSSIVSPKMASSAIYTNNPQSITVEKEVYNNIPNSQNPLHNSISQSNINPHISNLQPIMEDNNQVKEINLSKIDILDDEKNDLSLLEVKPIEQLNITNTENSILKKNKLNLIKNSNSLIDRYKSPEANSNINNMNQIVKNSYLNYMNYMNSVPNLSNNIDFTNNINNTNIIQNANNNNNELDANINNPLNNKLMHSMSDYSYNHLKNSVFKMGNISNNLNNKQINNGINKFAINNKKENNNNNRLNYNENYYKFNNNYNNNNYNSYNENNLNNRYNINDSYKINSNIIPMPYSINSNVLKDMDPEPNFNLSEFVKLKELGRGTEGTIYLVKWLKNNKEYALKKGKIKTFENLKKKQEEIKMLRDFREKTGNDGIIRIYGDKYLTKQGYYEFYEIMEFAEKDWDQEIYSRGHYKMFYTEEELITIMSQIIHTFALLQKNHITHRDIKPQNIMLVKGNFKITDFGNCRILKREGYCVQRIRGSEMYMSPIMFKGLHSKMPQVKHNSYKSDVFSLGMCFLLAAACSYHPLNIIREIYDMNSIYNIAKYYLGNRYSETVLNILFSMLQVEENMRPDFIQLDSFITQN